MGLLESLDAGVTGLVGQWNTYSTGLVTLLVAVVTYRIMSAREPDVHPMLLARQAIPATVRNEGESAVYRSQAAPHGMPLNTGLNVKDAGASKWSRGRDGDLRDVWRRAASGGEDGARGKILTVHGSEKVVEHKLEDINRQINIIGRHIADQGGIKVAIYLPNSIELLITLFACSFYPNLTTVLIPFDVSSEELVSMLRRSAVDTVVTAPGAFPFDAVVKAYPSLRQLIWVVDEGSSHMDWNEVPEGTGGSVNVATWQDIVNDAPAAVGAELPAVNLDYNPQDMVTFWQSKQGQLEEMVRFTQANLVAGIAGQMAAIPTKERLNPSDLFLPADSLTNIHTLVLTLTALYSNASVALTSVAGRSPDLVLATRGVAPTVVVASPGTMLKAHADSAGRLTSALAKLSHSLLSRNLTQEGVLSTSHPLASFSAGARPAIGTTPGKLRVVFVADRAGADSPHLSPSVLSDLRVFTGARVVYALAAARVAGAVSQTAFYDYRTEASGKGHFGAPPTSVEVFLKDKGAYKTTDDVIEGEIVARGPCVSGSEVNIGVVGRIMDDNTLAYV
ncbi:RNA helicase [Purpureocillium takamizusanense]|uniref:RNA helicase n=1 Tax=Purpureocillium takamizusanense TaxID=2060973 RepID=A0A9Q8QGP1_9HYPO|nr:RNA helicase [Purpureocillium takamizusanense]UNI18881.1 RNA helicase [Purpureocillium takamizusanense]